MSCDAGLLQLCAIDYRGFLKCNIEGSEFFMIDAASPQLHLAERAAIEIHDFGSDPQQSLDTFEAQGFTGFLVNRRNRKCIARTTRVRTPAPAPREST
jgi:hypothetical protein